MACPTCDHTMQVVSVEHYRKVSWCPRCGALRTETKGRTEDEPTRLFVRCRRFYDRWAERDEVYRDLRELGVAEIVRGLDGAAPPG